MGGGSGVLIGIFAVYWVGAFIGITVGLAGAALVFAGIKSPNFLPATTVNKNTNIRVLSIQ